METIEKQREWKEEGMRNGKMFVLPTESFQEYVEHPLVKSLYLTDVGYYPRAKGHFRERKEGIEEYILLYCTEGRGTVEIEGKKYLLEPNQAFCIPHFKGHRYYASEEEPWSILWVHFKGENTRYFPVEEYKTVTFTSPHAPERMHCLFDSLFRVLEENYTLGNFIYISQVLAMILAEIYHREKIHTTQEQNKHVTDVIRYMYKHLYENLSLEKIAEEFELSKSYLNAIFQKYTQHAPMDFFLHLKMKRACRMLRTTDYYVYEVAQKMGYTDQYYFSRIFKRIVGMSPKEYKRSDRYY